MDGDRPGEAVAVETNRLAVCEAQKKSPSITADESGVPGS